MMKSDLTHRSYTKLISVLPTLGKILPLRDAISDLPDKTLFHAGPPFERLSDIPSPMRNSMAAAALHEGWIGNPKDIGLALESSELHLMPAQDIGLVTPLAFIVGPSIYCVEVYDTKRPEQRRLSPLNDGPMPNALRFGTCRNTGRDILTRLTSEIGPELSKHIRTGTPLLPLLDYGLANGDDLHGHVAAAQSKVVSFFEAGVSDSSESYLEEANQFVLNIIMATAALMIGAGAGISGSQLIVAAGGNGAQFGYKIADAPDTWVVKPANVPIGPKFPGNENINALPAVGDSAVIDALGFGAACLRLCPTLQTALTGFVDPSFFTKAAHKPFVGPHPMITNQTIHVGLELGASQTCLGVMLGMVGAAGSEGLIGRGIADWPGQ